MRTLFFLALIGSAYSYFIYPLLLLILARRKPMASTRSQSSPPTVTIIIAAYNEQARIREKIINTLGTDYARTKMEIIVASDASSDGTDAIVEEYAQRGVRLVRSSRRAGKENAQRLAITGSSGQIIVFTDVSTRVEPDAVKRLVENFNDPRVGAVSSEDRFLSADGEPAGEGGYVRYEMWLRRLEAKANSLVGLSGSFFAVRRELCNEWDTETPSDFNSAINCVRHGYIAIADPEVYGFYPDIKDGSREYQRKLRTVIRGMASVARRAEVLNPFKYGMFAFQIWSHKVMRWLVPWFMLALFALSLLLYRDGFIYQFVFVAQLAFYSPALLAWVQPSLRSAAVFRIPLFFLQANAALAHAGLAFLLGRRMTVWEPSQR